MITTLILGLASCLSCSMPARQKENTPQNNLPPMQLSLTDSTKVNARNLTGKKIMFILFQPDCGHCQNEARQIAQRRAAFASYTLYFIAEASHEALVKFAHDYKLSGFSNIHFASTPEGSIGAYYGPIDAPSIYIYSSEGTLLNHFNGEMEIDVVLKYLN